MHKIVTGVTACQALLDEAVRLQADAVIVHHGYFWKNESPVIRGMKRRRLKTLLANDINLYGWHLPLDAHPELGNNAQLAHLLGINVLRRNRTAGAVGRAVDAGFRPRTGLVDRKRDWGVSRCGAAIPGRTPSAASPGVPAAARALSTPRRALAWTPLSPAKCRNKLFTLPASRACIFMPPATTPPSGAAFAPSANG